MDYDHTAPPRRMALNKHESTQTARAAPCGV